VPPSTIPVTPWDHQGRAKSKDDLVVCAGYVCSLPEVIEAARAHLHWSKGALRDFCRGEVPDQLFFGIEVFDGACDALSAWLMKPKDEQ
jgi:hypothetical protein